MAIQRLGQSGFRLELGGRVVYLDPYLSDRVERLEGASFRRQVAVPVQPGAITDADFVLVSHIHMDHCDIDTLRPMSQASPRCRFLGPREVIRYLQGEGIEASRLLLMNRDKVDLGGGLQVEPVPAAHKHVEQDMEGFLRYLGYVICFAGKRIFHSGDTCVHEVLVEAVRRGGAIDLALLPVNECNFYRDRAGIVGNMSIRDAFLLAAEIGAKRLVPMHYDMFAPNQVFREEIEVVYRNMSLPFSLDFDPREV